MKRNIAEKSRILRSKYEPGLCIFGVPVEEYSKEALMGAVCMLARQKDRDLEEHQRRLEFIRSIR